MINPYIRAANKFPDVKQQAKERLDKRKPNKPDKPDKPDRPTLPDKPDKPKGKPV